MMLFKGIMAASASLALMVTPVVAAAAPAQVNPAYESISGLQLTDDDDGGGILWLLGGAVVLGIVLWLVLKDDDDEDAPASP